jgi:hypothetical protein
VLAASLVGTTVEWYDYFLAPVILTALIALGSGALWWAGGYLVLTASVSLIAVATMPRFIGWRPAWAADARW